MKAGKGTASTGSVARDDGVGSSYAWERIAAASLHPRGDWSRLSVSVSWRIGD